MNNTEIWNKIVTLYNENRYSEEYKLQNLWLKIFEQYLHYNSLDNEIISQIKVRLGSKERLIPDIALRKNNKDFVLVELKKETLNSCNDFKRQLFDYLKLLKVSIGILITNKIELFIYDYLKEDNKQPSIEIEFIKNNPLGEQFVELFKNHNLELGEISDFVKLNCDIKNAFNEISSMTNENLIKDILLDYFTAKGYHKQAINNYLSTIKIEIKQNVGESCSTQKRDCDGSQPRNITAKNDYSLDKSDAMRICQRNNVKIPRCVTFANLSNINGKYPANVKLSYLNEEWMLLLNDGFNNKLHIFKVPANTFSQNDFYIREDKNLIVLAIDNYFDDTHPQQKIYNRFYEYKIQTIDYKNEI